MIIEIGITSQDRLRTVKTEKLHKYDMLGGELSMIHKCRTRIIPYVMTWDGIVTKCHRSYVRQLGLPTNVEAYIQTRVLKRTLEARRSVLDSNGDMERLEKAMDQLLERNFLQGLKVVADE